MTYPRWWEQMGKNERCLAAVERREERQGWRYQWLVKARAEYHWRGHLSAPSSQGAHYDAISVESFLHALRACPQCVWTHPYPPRGGTDCYPTLDWAAVMPRARPAFMTIARADCAWVGRTVQHFLRLGWEPGRQHGSRNFCQANERWLAKWIRDTGLRFVPLLTGAALLARGS